MEADKPVTLEQDLRGRAWAAANYGDDAEHDRLEEAAMAVEQELDEVTRIRLYREALEEQLQAAQELLDRGFVPTELMGPPTLLEADEQALRRDVERWRRDERARLEREGLPVPAHAQPKGCVR